MDLREALKGAGVSGLKISPADVFIASDQAIVIPETKTEDRKYHEKGRTCIVLSNRTICSSISFPIVSIAPTSHRVELKAATDFPLKATPENGLNQDSLVMLGHVQPLRKVDLIKKIGVLPPDIWTKLLVHMLANIDPGFLGQL